MIIYSVGQTSFIGNRHSVTLAGMQLMIFFDSNSIRLIRIIIIIFKAVLDYLPLLLGTKNIYIFFSSAFRAEAAESRSPGACAGESAFYS